jgi:hypothetical protein
MEHESLTQLGVQRGDSLRHVAPFGRHSSGEGWSRPPPGAGGASLTAARQPEKIAKNHVAGRLAPTGQELERGRRGLEICFAGTDGAGRLHNQPYPRFCS